MEAIIILSVLVGFLLGYQTRRVMQHQKEADERAGQQYYADHVEKMRRNGL